MADIIVDGMTWVAFVPTIAAPATGVTVAELTAGEVLHDLLVAGGMEGFEASTGEVDNTAFSSRFDTRLPGVSSYSGTRLVLKKQDGEDTVHALLTAFNTSGFIVVRDAVDKDVEPAADQTANIYPITTGDWDYMSRERNSVLRYWVATPISAEPFKDVPITAA